MLFFLLLYGFTRLSQDEQQDIYGYFQASGRRSEEMRYRAGQVMREFSRQDTAAAMSSLAASLGDDASIEETDTEIRLTLNNPRLFELGSPRLSSRRDIEHLAYMLSQIDTPLIIEGHTDNIPIRGGHYSSNWELSAARSVSVIEELVNTYGFNSERFIAAGYGEFHPGFPNDTPENRARNRRIEVVVPKR